MERVDDIAKVSRTLISMDEENRERNFIRNPKLNWKSVKTG